MGTATLRDILFNNTPEARARIYGVSGRYNVGDKIIERHIDRITIDGNVFTDYRAYSFALLKSYVKSPVRSGSGVIENLNSYATFLTPQLQIDFSIISIDSYRALIKLLRSKNEFTVTCYDVVENMDVTYKMYFEPNELPKLYTIARALNGDDIVELLGVQDFSIKMVGTNSALDNISVIYHLNPPSDSGATDRTIAENDLVKGQEVIIGQASTFQDETFNGKYKFNGWNTSQIGVGMTYLEGGSYQVSNNIILYAQWVSIDEYILSFNYGLAKTQIDPNTNQYITNRKVVVGKQIGVLPTIELPLVEVNGQKTSGYIRANWYKTPTITENSTPIEATDTYWTASDSTIYAILHPFTYKINYNIDGIITATDNVDYNTNIPLPQYVKEGFTFDGWYKTNEYKEKISGLMPIPNDGSALYVFARWLKNNDNTNG